MKADDIGPAYVPVLRPSVASIALDDEVVVLEELTSTVHYLDGTAALVWRCLDGHGSVEEIVDDLAVVFRAPYDVMQEDVLHLIRQLADLDLFVDAPAT